ncbi:glycosyltransferase family 4 protein [Microbacterium sp. Mu-80]|uniref:Glycosyltransferase family 4 protein n=1 Tax=Microbacterium bandirmense TaxID=3122050 RepID=A0ABU8L7V0_9MICO
MVSALADVGADVRVLTTSPPRSARRADDDPRVDVRRWPVLRNRSGYVRGYLPYLSFDLPLFFRVLFGRKADVYVCEPPPTTGFLLRVAAQLRRTPYVYYGADIWSDASAATGAPRIVLRVVRGLEQVALRGAHTVLVVSEGVRQRVTALAPDVPTSVVGHGVDLNTFAPDGPCVEEPVDIVYVGTASEWHGAGLAIEALSQVMGTDETVTAAFVGQGSEWDGLKRRVDELGLQSRIRFLPTVAAEEAAAWLRTARVSLATLAPGQGYDFAVPTKLYSSVAVGTPVAYAGPDPVRRLIIDEGLGAATHYEPAAYAQAIGSLLSETRGADEDLVRWAGENISSVAVAERAVQTIVRVARPGSVQARK